MEVFIKQPVLKPLKDSMDPAQHLKVIQDHKEANLNFLLEQAQKNNIQSEHINPVLGRESLAVGIDDPLSIIRLQLKRLFKEFGNGPHFDAFESLVVHQAFSYVESNQVHGAALLGISRNVMRTLLKRHGLLANRNNYKVQGCSNDSKIDNLDLNGGVDIVLSTRKSSNE
jgi:transcriptional regulator with AAA-type ATPase domain